MRVPIVEYVTLALSSNLGYSASGPPSVEVAPLGVTINSPRCWASSTGVAGNFGPIHHL